MRHHYSDITSRVSEEPKWFDENGVPRYCDFAPNETANIYASECALFRVHCQSCGRPFDVAASVDDLDVVVRKQSRIDALIRLPALEYGDPPNMGCCPSGPTMNSEPQVVLQYWKRGSGPTGWERDTSLEIAIPAEWAR